METKRVTRPCEAILSNLATQHLQKTAGLSRRSTIKHIHVQDVESLTLSYKTASQICSDLLNKAADISCACLALGGERHAGRSARCARNPMACRHAAAAPCLMSS